MRMGVMITAEISLLYASFLWLCLAQASHPCAIWMGFKVAFKMHMLYAWVLAVLTGPNLTSAFLSCQLLGEAMLNQVTPSENM